MVVSVVVPGIGGITLPTPALGSPGQVLAAAARQELGADRTAGIRAAAPDPRSARFPDRPGGNSSVTKKVIERLYGCSALLNSQGQSASYGRAGGCLVTGNEDGVKHRAMNVPYSLQHLGHTVPPQADAGWTDAPNPDHR